MYNESVTHGKPPPTTEKTMSVEILTNADDTMACMTCNTADWAFGPVYRGDDAYEVIAMFANTVLRDPRLYSSSELEKLWGEFFDILKTCDRCGTIHVVDICPDCKEAREIAKDWEKEFDLPF